MHAMKPSNTLMFASLLSAVVRFTASTQKPTYNTHLYALKQRPYAKLVLELIERNTMSLCKHIIPYPDASRINYTSSHRHLIEMITEKNSTRIFEMLNLNQSYSDQNFLMIGPSTFNDLKKVNKDFYKSIVLVQSNPVLILQKSKVLLLTKFLLSFQNCFTAIIFALLCAMIVCTVIWVIETLSGTNHFPASPAAGVLSSFWFTVVTMTTVGYGDKTPKHPLSRLITVVWIMFGLMLVALITASAWNSIGEEFNTEGKTIGVIDRSVEESIASKTLVGHVKRYHEYADILHAVQKGDVDAALMERYVAAGFFAGGKLGDLVIERELDTDITLRMFAHFQKKVVGCKDDDASMNDEEVEDEKETITDFIGDPYKTEKYFLQPLSRVFNGHDNHGLMMYMGSIGLCIVIFTLVGEIVYRASSHKHGKRARGKEGAEHRERYEKFREQVEQFVEEEVSYRLRNRAPKTTIANTHAHLSVD